MINLFQQFAIMKKGLNCFTHIIGNYVLVILEKSGTKPIWSWSFILIHLEDSFLDFIIPHRF